MDKATHGRRLAAAMDTQRVGRDEIADLAGTSTRTVTNWRKGVTMPTLGQREAIRSRLGAYDADGDPVEVAVRASRLTDDRQHVVLGTYKRELREQDEASERRRTG